MAELECRETEEYLPWFEHGGLPPEAREGIERHLAGCERCRSALAATREASALFAAHPPAEALVDYAFGLAVQGVSRAALELHLAHCEMCREELGWVESDRPEPLAESAKPAPSPAVRPAGSAERSGTRPRGGASWPVALALAAMLAVASGLTVFLAMRGPALPAGGRVALVELAPQGARLRAADGAVTRVTRREATTILLLSDRAESFDERRARVLSATTGSELWRAEDLLAVGEGAFALHLPARALPAGEISLELEGRRGSEWTPLERYRLAVDP